MISWGPKMQAVYGYEACTIRRVENGRVKAVACGGIEVGGYDLPCFPATSENLRLASKIREVYNEMSSLPGTGGANWPMISSYLEQNCVHGMSGAINHEEVIRRAEVLRDELRVAASALSSSGLHLFRQE